MASPPQAACTQSSGNRELPCTCLGGRSGTLCLPSGQLPGGPPSSCRQLPHLPPSACRQRLLCAPTGRWPEGFPYGLPRLHSENPAAVAQRPLCPSQTDAIVSPRGSGSHLPHPPHTHQCPARAGCLALQGSLWALPSGLSVPKHQENPGWCLQRAGACEPAPASQASGDSGMWGPQGDRDSPVHCLPPSSSLSLQLGKTGAHLPGRVAVGPGAEHCTGCRLPF